MMNPFNSLESDTLSALDEDTSDSDFSISSYNTGSNKRRKKRLKHKNPFTEGKSKAAERARRTQVKSDTRKTTRKPGTGHKKQQGK